MESRDEGQSLCRLWVWVKWDEEEEKERWRFWNQVESRDENGEDGDIRVYVCGGEKTREKKKRKRMDERKKKKKNWPFRNTTTIFLYYFHNKF